MTRFGPRLTGLMEAMILLTLLLGIDQFIGGGNGFAGIEPHPFWIAVIVVASRYGVLEAVAAASLATGAFIVPGLPSLNAGTSSWLALLVNPVLWFGAAIVISGARRTVEERSRRISVYLKASDQRARLLMGEIEWLHSAKLHLEGRMESQFQAAKALYEIAVGADDGDSESALNAIATMVKAGLQPQKFTIYLVSTDGLQLVRQNGWTAPMEVPAVFSPQSPLYQAVIGRARVVCAAMAGDEAVLGPGALLAGPMRCPQSGRISGMIKIESMNALDLHTGAVADFELICAWAGEVFDRVRRGPRNTASAIDRTITLAEAS